MFKEHIYLGKIGEGLAVRFLKKHGYRILLENYKSKIGEIDIIAYEKDCLCFVEVKTRHSDKFGLPSEAVSSSKQRKISQVALIFLKENNLLSRKARFDVVSIVYLKGQPRIDLFKDAFELIGDFIY